MKVNRHAKIVELINKYQIETQDELAEYLNEAGFKVTQATLSRDLKQLKVAKAASMNGKYVYVLPNETMYRSVSSPRLASEMMRMPGFLSINFSGNIGVIRTRPGYASSIAYNIDNGHIEDILGTIAGDDTIFIVVKEGVSQQQLVSKLSCVIQGLTL